MARPNHSASASASASLFLASASASAFASCPAGLVNITAPYLDLLWICGEVDVDLFVAHPLCAKRRRGGLMFCWCFIFLDFSDFCQTNYLNIYWTDLHRICRIGSRGVTQPPGAPVTFLGQGLKLITKNSRTVGGPYHQWGPRH